MATKPVKVLSDLLTKKQIIKQDSNNNVLFNVSGVLGNGHVSSSLPITASYFVGDGRYLTNISGSGGISSVYTSGSITGSGLLINPVTLKDPLIIGTVTASLGFSGNLYGTASLATSASYAATASYAINAGGGITSVSSSGNITGSGLSGNEIRLKDNITLTSVTASFNGNLQGTASYAISSSFATNALTASAGFIGQAEDSDYTDGLFTDFTTATPIGTAIDRFNEVLKGLAPSAAPSLSVIEKTSGATGTSMKLAFGASAPVSGYTSVTASSLIGATLTNVDIAGTYSSINGSGGSPIRMAVYASPITLTMSLNNATTADAATYTNYPAKAFNVSTDGIGSYKLEVNGTELTPTGSTVTTASANTATFSLSAANTASFINSGQGFTLFRNRTGTVGIPTSSWRNGHNYAKVTQVSSLGTNITNYIDWVYDPSAASGVDVYTFATPTSASFSATGAKYLSGIKYYTGATYNFTTTVGNFYKNVYPTAGGLTFGSVTTGMSATSVSIPTPTANTDTISISSLHTLNGSVRILGSTLASTLTANNGMGKTGTSTLTTNTILYDGISTSNTTTSENFCLENYRAASGSYDTQTSASNAIGAFTSGSSLASGELAVYSGGLRYPTQVLNSGNVSGSGIIHMISGQPNYSGVSDDRYFYRVFQNGASAVATFTVTINGGSGINVVTYNTALNSNNVRVWVKVPGKTGWRDISTSTPAPGYSALTDNLGALQGTKTTTSTSSTHTINLLTEGLAVGEYLLIRVQASSAWTNNISSIAITGL